MTGDTLDGRETVRMTDDDIDGFLSSQSVGVLGLPGDDAPAMRPMSFSFDGASGLYFLYVLPSTGRSEKAMLTEAADVARFLVYRADTPFTWTSVLLTGRIDEVPEDGRDDLEAAIDLKRRPDAFERISSADRTGLYRFEIDEKVGIKQSGIPPELERGSSEE